MDEILRQISALYCHLRTVETHMNNQDLGKAEFRAKELAANASLLVTALYWAQHRSGEVK